MLLALSRSKLDYLVTNYYAPAHLSSSYILLRERGQAGKISDRAETSNRAEISDKNDGQFRRVMNIDKLLLLIYCEVAEI